MKEKKTIFFFFFLFRKDVPNELMTIKLFQNLKKKLRKPKSKAELNNGTPKHEGSYIFPKTDRKDKETIKQTNKQR